MKRIPDKYLPIGTVVMLKGGTKRLMIAGFCAIESEKPEENEEMKIWDYSGCLYPEGLLQSNQVCLFDHEQIKEIYHLGLSTDEDEEEKVFKDNLSKIIEEVNINKNKENKKKTKINNKKRKSTTTKK